MGGVGAERPTAFVSHGSLTGWNNSQDAQPEKCMYNLNSWGQLCYLFGWVRGPSHLVQHLTGILVQGEVTDHGLGLQGSNHHSARLLNLVI